MFLTRWLQRTETSRPAHRDRRPPRRRQSPCRRRTTPLLQLEQLEHRWCPSYSLVTSRAALAGTDSVDWGTLGRTGTIVANPFTILSTAGRSISVSKAVAGTFNVQEQCPAPDCSWSGNFSPGDWLLDTANIRGSKSNPITLNFGTTAVAAGGAQIAAAYFGAFTAKVEAFDANGQSLATFTEAGTSTGAADNSAIFIGISSSSPNISQIALSLTSAQKTKSWFVINKFDFRSSALAAAPAVRQPAPVLNLALLAPSALRTGQQATPVAPSPGSAAQSAPPPSPSRDLPPFVTSSHAPVAASDAAFAASHTEAKHDDAWPFAPPASVSAADF